MKCFFFCWKILLQWNKVWEYLQECSCGNVSVAIMLFLWQEKKKQNGKFETACFYTFCLKCIDFSSLRTLSKCFFEYLKMNQYYCQNWGVIVYNLLLNSYFQVISKLFCYFLLSLRMAEQAQMLVRHGTGYGKWWTVLEGQLFWLSSAA